MSGQPKRPWRLLYRPSDRYPWRVYGTYATERAALKALDRRPIIGQVYKVDGPPVPEDEKR